jgi:hypothetical protein
MLCVLALAATSNAVLAQQGGQPPAKGPAMALALEAAQAAWLLVLQMASRWQRASSILLAYWDCCWLPTVSSDQIEISRKKAVTAVALKAVTSEVADKMEKDQALKTKIEADQTLFPRPGGVPLMVGNDVIGAIGVSGASRLNLVPGGVRDEACAKAGVEKIKARLK